MSATERPAEPTSSMDERVYRSRFWLVYAANFALVAANTLMYRFAELVAFLDGTEKAAGAIVGTGFAAALCVRLVIGQGVDRYGTRLIWVVSCSSSSSGIFRCSCATKSRSGCTWHAPYIPSAWPAC